MVLHGKTPNSVLIAIVMFLLGACGTLPQPFQVQGEVELPLPQTPSTMGIGVIPVFGITNEKAIVLSQLIADELQQREFPAQAVDGIGRMRFSLETTVTESRLSLGSIELAYEWRVLGRTRDTVRHSGTGVIVVADDEWYDGSLAGLNQIAGTVAGRVTDVIGPPTTRATLTESPWQGLTILIQPPGEAPGDGATALSRILANRLARLGFAPASGQADFTLAGKVSVSPYDSAQDDIAIIWQVFDPAGEDLGEVRLDNRIPKGDLDGSWGLVAEAIIDTALPGLIEIMAVSRPISRSE